VKVDGESLGESPAEILGAVMVSAAISLRLAEVE